MTNSDQGTNRRSILKAGMALTGAIAAPAVFRGPAEAQEKILYVNTWGGSYTAAEEEAYYKPFQAETGIRIRPVTPVSFAKLKAQVQSGVYEWDCSNFNQADLILADKQGLVEKIDWSIVRRENLNPNGGTLKDIGIVTYVLNTNLAYRRDKFPDGGPTSWADFWDVKKFPQKRAMWDRSFTAMAFALIADGVPLNKLYPLDVDRAFKKLDQIKRDIKVWYRQGNQIQLFKDGEIDMLPLWGSRLPEVLDAGVPVEMVWDGAEVVPSNWCVAKGTPRAKLAWQFIDFCARPDRLAVLCERVNYGPLNPKALEYMKPDVVKNMPTTPENAAKSFVPDSEWIAERLPALLDRWTQWLAA
jgi:putative spermidine/putrescine transport system substrate-binding protein